MDNAHFCADCTESPCANVSTALEVAREYGGVDGDHHKAWVIDQMVRALTGDGYAAFVANARAGADGPESYEWSAGVAP
jgi:hypothetical protein